MEKICNRCNKRFNTNTLYESLIKNRRFSRCNDCYLDVSKRERVKKYLLKKYDTLTKEEKKFISNHRDINIQIPKTNNPKFEENRTKQKVKGEKVQCITCLDYLNPSEFYKSSNSSLFKRCKSCHKQIVKNKRETPKKPGYIYIIFCKTWVGYYKIGKTNNIENRLFSYQTCSPFRDFEVIYLSKFFENSTMVEIKIENLFGKYKVEGNEEYEWYKLTKEELSLVIKTLKETEKSFIR